MDRETLADLRQQIRERISCSEYLTRSKGGQYVCPICGSGTGPHKTGAVKLYEDSGRWYCHACCAWGDVIDLYKHSTGATERQALEDLAAQAGLQFPGRSEVIKKGENKARHGILSGQPDIVDAPGGKNAQEAPKLLANDYSKYYQKCAKEITEPAAEVYLKMRGISLETATAYGVGYDPYADPAHAPGGNGEKKKPCPRIIIPASPDFYIARSIDPEGQRYANPSGSPISIFNSDCLYAQDVREVFITEGVFDALSILEAGGAALALNSTANVKKLIAKLTERPTDCTLLLCLDNDEAGRKATEGLADGLRQLHIPFIDVCADLCGSSKDPNKALTTNRPQFLEAVNQAKAESAERKEAQLAEAQQEALERQQRTGAGMVDRFMQTIKTRKYEPIPTGIFDIDQAIGGGLFRQQLILLGAAPGAGKTALAQWLFEGMATHGTPVLYLNLEMSREQILARSIARIANRNGHRVKPTDILQGYKWTEAQEAAIMDAADEYRREIAPQMIYNPDGVTADLDSILRYIEDEANRAEAADLPAPAVVVDYLQIVHGGPYEDEKAVIKRAVSSLKAYAIKHNAVVCVIIAHNREANKSGTVTMESGRDTSALEYSADLQLGLAYTLCLNRNGQKGKDKDELTPEEMKLLTLKVTKGRFSAPGASVDLFFNGEAMSFNLVAKEPGPWPEAGIKRL